MKEELLKLKQSALEKKDYEAVKKINLELKKFDKKVQSTEKKEFLSLASLFTEKEEPDYETMYEQYKKNMEGEVDNSKEKESTEIVAEIKEKSFPVEQSSELLSDFNILKDNYNDLIQFMNKSHRRLIDIRTEALHRGESKTQRELTSVCGYIGKKLKEIHTLEVVKAPKTDE